VAGTDESDVGESGAEARAAAAKEQAEGDEGFGWGTGRCRLLARRPGAAGAHEWAGAHQGRQRAELGVARGDGSGRLPDRRNDSGLSDEFGRRAGIHLQDCQGRARSRSRWSGRAPLLLGARPGDAYLDPRIAFLPSARFCASVSSLRGFVSDLFGASLFSGFAIVHHLLL